MNEYFDPQIGFTVREFFGSNNFMRFQIGEMRNIHRTAEPIGRTLPLGYAMMVKVFYMRAFGSTMDEAVNKLNL